MRSPITIFNSSTANERLQVQKKKMAEVNKWHYSSMWVRQNMNGLSQLSAYEQTPQLTASFKQNKQK